MDSDPTPERIRGALETLIDTTPMSKITVGKIVAEAGVSRQTFYYHFDNILGIYKWALENILERDRRDDGHPFSFTRALNDWYLALEGNRKLTLAFARSQYAIEVLEFIKEDLMDSARAFILGKLDIQPDPAALEICASYLVGANISIMVDWINLSMEPSVRDIYEAKVKLMGAILHPELMQAIMDDWHSFR